MHPHRNLLLKAMVLTGASWLAVSASIHSATPLQAAPRDFSGGVVFAMTNDAHDNQVQAFVPSGDGHLIPSSSFSTGGRGSGQFENSANALVWGERSPGNLPGSYRFLYATNPGSDDISVFAVENNAIRRVGTKYMGPSV